jgi:hypothetical protein
VAFNDSSKTTVQNECALQSGGGGTAGGSSCPSVAANPTATTCPGDAYAAYILNDGAGLRHSVTENAGTSSDAASILSVTGINTFSADRLTYGYSYTGDATSDSGDTTVSANWSRDLHGLPTSWAQSVDGGDGSSSTQASDTMAYNELRELTSATNQMTLTGGGPLQETHTYSPTHQLATSTSYAGVQFSRYYDDMDRLVRLCFPSEGGGSEGETYSRDAITGKLLQITHFTNSGDCSECADGNCGDIAGVSETYTYTPFGAVASKTFSDGTVLQWAYDAYQRKSCFADGMATAAGNACPSSPTDSSFAPPADQQLITYTYWEDSDPYRRGMLKSMCRGVPNGTGGYVTKCLDRDYYTPVDSGGACDPSLSGISGGFAGLLKSESFCSGGSCLAGTGSLIYQSTRLYDAHQRPCSVQSSNAAGQVILGSTYTYDQFGNVVHEAHTSDLDPSTGSNYQMDYVYDGMLRLTQESRSDSSDVLLETISYTYDAAANLLTKVRQYADATTATPTPIASPTPAPTNTPTILPTATATATELGQPEPTNTATAKPKSGGGCQVDPSSTGSGWILLTLAISVLLLARRRGEER